MPLIAELTVAGWRRFVEEHVAAGWQPYLLSFMFNPLPGGQARRMDQMTALIEDAYGMFVTRVVRNPRSPNQHGKLPIWLCSPDLPVWKHEKKSDLHDLRVNDGLHYHATLLMPPVSRLDDVEGHFPRYTSKYQELAHVRRIYAVPITHFDGDPVGYIQKQSLKGNFKVDDNFALPRSLNELPARRPWIAPQTRLPGKHHRPTVLNAIRP